MNGDLKPYTEYKESGLLWPSHVPGHWDVSQARHIGRLFKAIGGTKEDTTSAGVSCVRYGEMYTTYNYVIRASKGFISPERVSSYTPIQYGDVLFAASGETIEDIGKSAVNLIPVMAVCGGDIIVLRPSIPVHSPFLGYAMDSRPAANQKASMGRGSTVKHIYPDELKSLIVPLPPLDEQGAIVRFIRHLDQRVNRLLTGKRKLIDLLNEQKQAIIQRAVTRGLDPTVQLKPSGIDWAGCVPIHWEVRRIKHISKILRGRFSYRPRNDPILYDGAYPFIQTGDVARSGKVIRSYRQTLNEQGLAVSKLFPAGTLVMTIAANIGDVAVLDFEACFPDSIVGFVPDNLVDRDFMYYTFIAMKDELLREAPVSTQGNLNVDRVGCRALALPPKVEQTAIVSYIEQSTADLERTIATTRDELELIRDYRTRLVSDVVTGQLDVRHLDLPDVDDEPVNLIDESDDIDELAGDDLAEAAV